MSLVRPSTSFCTFNTSAIELGGNRLSLFVSLNNLFSSPKEVCGSLNTLPNVFPRFAKFKPNFDSGSLNDSEVIKSPKDFSKVLKSSCNWCSGLEASCNFLLVDDQALSISLPA